MDEQLSRKILDWLNHPEYRPVKRKSLAKHFHLKGPERKALHETLDGLIAAGQVREDSRGRLVTRVSPGQFVGTIKKTSAGGAFVIPDSGPAPGGDIYVHPEDLRDAHTGDEVLVKLSGRRGMGGKRLGKVEEILNRASSTFVGTYTERGGRGFVRVDADQFDREIPVGDPGAKGAEPGDKVVIEMLRFPTHAKAGEAVLLRVLGPSGEPQVDTLSIIYEFGLPTEFPQAALDEAANQAREFDEQDLQGRRDLTAETIVTIDPADARDFDDAISLKRTENGHWVLGVHIADVAHFVRPGGELDQEAMKRGTSVYLPGLVIPMLPEVLSNGLASLQQDRLRYTKSVFIELDSELRVVHTEFANSAIRVTRRFAYEQVLAIIKRRDDSILDDLTPEVARLLFDMHELAMKLRKRRFELGALELDLSETRLELNRAGEVTKVYEVVHDESHQIIEEFMLAANEAVATAALDRHAPLIRRVHGEPDEEKLKLFGEFVATLGLTLKKFQSRKELQQLLLQVRDEPIEQAVNYALLRSFRQAEYSVAEEGHYALGMENYCHFTSPIRRYPDLTVHRTIGGLVSGKKGRRGPSVDQLDAIARKCSELARRAESAERELIKVKMLRHMADRIGEEIEAVVTGVERFGVFCRGLHLPVEGLLHITAIGAALNEIIDHDEAAHALVARTSGRTIQIGRPIRVKVARVDVEARKLDFLPSDEFFSAGGNSSPPLPSKKGKIPMRQSAGSKKGPHKKSSRPPSARQPGRRRRGR